MAAGMAPKSKIVAAAFDDELSIIVPSTFTKAVQSKKGSRVGDAALWDGGGKRHESLAAKKLADV